jgi:hypothetical protein
LLESLMNWTLVHRCVQNIKISNQTSFKALALPPYFCDVSFRSLVFSAGDFALR